MSFYTPNIQDADYKRGLEAIKIYYNEAKKFYSKKVTYSIDELLKVLQARKGQAAFLEGLGLGINSSGMSNNQVSLSMRNLAFKSQGMIPSKNGDFFSFLINEATQISFIDAFAYVAVESTKDVIKGAQTVGDSLLLTGKLFTFAIPFLVAILIYFWVKKQK